MLSTVYSLVIATLLLLCVQAYPAGRSTLDGRFGNYTSYFPHDGKIRHHRYDLLLTQTVSLSKYVTTVAEGRARFDAALINANWIPRHDFSSEVRNDEMFEAEGRQLYLDLLEDTYRAKLGLQYVDWVETLSPFTTDLLTAYDLRFGGEGSQQAILVPVLAANLNHKLFGGTLDWLLVPLPKHHRLPVGDNAYGYYPFLNRLAAPRTARIVDEPNPVRLSDVEYGARYLMSLSALDLSFIAYYGHQRSPAIVLRPLSVSALSVEQTYPHSLTLGAFSTYSKDAWVFRAMAFVQPRHTPKIRIKTSPLANDSPDWTETWTHFGLGFDYVFSADLKVYTEVFAHFVNVPPDATALGGKDLNHNTRDYVTVIRLTNESFKNVTLSLTTSLTAPHFSYMLTPEVGIKYLSKYRVTLGGQFVGSNSVDSDFEILKHSSRVYLGLEYNFDIW